MNVLKVNVKTTSSTGFSTCTKNHLPVSSGSFKAGLCWCWGWLMSSSALFACLVGKRFMTFKVVFWRGLLPWCPFILRHSKRSLVHYKPPFLLTASFQAPPFCCLLFERPYRGKQWRMPLPTNTGQLPLPSFFSIPRQRWTISILSFYLKENHKACWSLSQSIRSSSVSRVAALQRTVCRGYIESERDGPYHPSSQISSSAVSSKEG